MFQVDASVTELDRRVPPTLKKVSSQAMSAAQKAPEVVDKASGFAKSVYTKCEPTAKGLYNKYEPKAEQCAATAWRGLNRLPLFPKVAGTAAYCTEVYNSTVVSAAEKGYKVSSYLPLVPVEKIAKVFASPAH